MPKSLTQKLPAENVTARGVKAGEEQRHSCSVRSKRSNNNQQEQSLITIPNPLIREIQENVVVHDLKGRSLQLVKMK